MPSVTPASRRIGRGLAWAVAAAVVFLGPVGLLAYFGGGRLLSDTPQSGFDFDTHVSQVWRVVEGLQGWNAPWIYDVQHLAGHEVTFGKTRSTKTPGQYNVVFEIQDKDVGLEASRLALRLIHSLLPEELKKKYADREFNFEKERDWFIRYTQKRELGPSTGSLVKAAEARLATVRGEVEALLARIGGGAQS